MQHKRLKGRRAVDRTRCLLCGKLLTYSQVAAHNLWHAKRKRLVVHYSFGGRLEDIKPICGTKTRRRDPVGVYLVSVHDGKDEFDCKKCRRLLNKWNREEPERRVEVKKNLKKALKSPAHLKRLKAVKNAKAELKVAMAKVGTYAQVSRGVKVAEEKLEKVTEQFRRYDPREQVERGIWGSGPLRSRKKKHCRPGGPEVLPRWLR